MAKHTHTLKTYAQGNTTHKIKIDVNTLYLKSLELCKLLGGFIRKKQSSYIWKEKHC